MASLRTRPDHSLGVGSESHALQTARVMQRIEPVFRQEDPDCVIVYGDTNSTLAGAITAAKIGVWVAHSEAGMRSFNRSMPEELNRIVVDHLSNILLCPTRTSVANLRKEGIVRRVGLVGDVMYDSALAWGPVARRRRMAARLGLSPQQYLLLTLHRPANVDDPTVLSRILGATGRFGQDVVFPVHPRTKHKLRAARLLRKVPPNVRLIEPLDYLDFLALLMESHKVLTDSGGVQKQAYFFGVPCITLRRETEWVETVASGWNVLVGTNQRSILAAVRRFEPAGPRPKHYGSGNAASRVVTFLETSLRGRSEGRKREPRSGSS